MDLLRKVTMAHGDVNLIDLFDPLESWHVLKILVVFVSVLHDLLVLLLLFDVVALEFVIDVHVHIVFLHGCELLLHSLTNIVLSLLNRLHLDEDVVELAGMLRIEINVKDLQVLLDQLSAILLVLSVLMTKDIRLLEVLQHVKPELHLEDLKVLAVLVYNDVVNLEGVVANCDCVLLHELVLLTVQLLEAEDGSDHEADSKEVNGVIDEKGHCSMELELKPIGVVVDVLTNFDAHMLR